MSDTVTIEKNGPRNPVPIEDLRAIGAGVETLAGRHYAAIVDEMAAKGFKSFEETDGYLALEEEALIRASEMVSRRRIRIAKEAAAAALSEKF